MRREDKYKIIKGTLGEKIKDFKPSQIERIKVRDRIVDMAKNKRRLEVARYKRMTEIASIKTLIANEISVRSDYNKRKKEYSEEAKEVKRLKQLISKSELQIKKLKLHTRVCRGALVSNKRERLKEFKENNGVFDDKKLKQLRISLNRIK